MTDYGRRIVVGLGFEEALGELHRALRLEGLEVVARIDVRDRFWQDLGHAFRQYYLVEAWSPQLACEALSNSPDVGVILPTTFAVYELPDGQTVIAGREPLYPLAEDAGRWRHAPILTAIAGLEAQRVARVFASLTHASDSQRGRALAPSC